MPNATAFMTHLVRSQVEMFEAGTVGMDRLQDHAARYPSFPTLVQGPSGKWYRFADGAVTVTDDMPE